jgi:glycosyltransferase involved in cell wall biosynthesis
VREPQAPLRIAFLTHEPFYPPSGGGSAEAVYLVEEMARRGHKVHIFCPRFADAENISQKFGIVPHLFTKWHVDRYTRLRNLKYLAYPIFLERMALKAARQTKYDVIVSQHAVSAVAAGKLKRKLKIPVVMNFLDLLTGFMETWPPYIAPPPLVAALKRHELSLPLKYEVDGVLTVSDTLADLFAARGYPRAKICPIYYGYDSASFPFHASPSSRKGPPVVVMHGSFDAHHLGKIAFGAIKFVVQRRPDVVFRFLGRRTATLDRCLAAVKREIPGCRFEAPGFVPYTEISRYLADASVGIVPYEESSGTHCAFVAKAVEYVASGLPAVSTPLKSIQSYFRDDPMVRFSKFDGEDFGRKVLGWLNESPDNWQPRASASATRVRAELDWRPLCRKAVDFVEMTMAHSSRKIDIGK